MPESGLTEGMRAGWTAERGGHSAVVRYVRSDGATVKYDMGPSKMQWIAYEPDPSEAYLIRYSKRGLGWPRRWSTPEAAMRAVDREYPAHQGGTDRGTG